MNLTDDFILKCQIGCPVFLDDICAIYPATMREIINLDYSKFLQFINILDVSKPSEMGELTELIKPLSDFQYLIFLANIDSEFNSKLKEAFYFFTHEGVFFSMSPFQIIFGPLSEKHLMTEEKFYEFRRIVRRMYFIDVDGDEIIINEDDSPQVRGLKEVMRKNREKVAKAKAKQIQANNQNSISFSDLLGSLTINNCGLNMENIGNITYYAFQDQLKRMGWRDKFNINNQAAMAGAKIKKKELTYWIKSISDSKKNN